jgi:microcystin degradation protein MlrC
MRIFFGGIATETNTFSPIPTGLSAYESCFLVHAGEHPDEANLFTAPLWALKERKRQGTNGNAYDWEIIQGLCAFAQPGARTTRHAYESMRDEMLADLQRAMPLDLVVLGLHGAMIAEGYDDCEGDMLRRVRAIIGPNAIIGAELDLHCILTNEMVAESNVLVAFKEYPHTDIMDRAFDLVDICIDAVNQKVTPVSTVVNCNMIDMMHTTREPMQSIVARMFAMEKMPGVLSVSIAHSFAWGDVPGMGAKVLVVTDNNPALGQTLANELRDAVWAARGIATAPHPPLAEALSQALTALQSIGGPIVIADTADNPGAGAAGDSTYLLAALLEKNIGNVAIGPMWDPIATQFCFDVGVGATLALRLGGKVGAHSGEPVDVTAKVIGLKREAAQLFAGMPVPLGNAALIQVEIPDSQPIEIVISTLRTQCYGAEVFTQFGVDLGAKNLIVVKSMQHFYAAFAPIAKKIIYMGSPGAASRDLKALKFLNIPRPMWPFDE